MNQPVLLMSPSTVVIPKKAHKGSISETAFYNEFIKRVLLSYRISYLDKTKIRYSNLLSQLQNQPQIFNFSYFGKTKRGYSNPLIQLQLARIRNNLSHSSMI